jgi:DNA polymerase
MPETTYKPEPLTIEDDLGNKFPVWTLDFESYYDTALKYSLSHKDMTTTSYVRSPLFKAHGLSVIDPKGNPYWVTHDELPEFFSKHDFTKVAVLCHNTMFDGFIMFEHFNVKAGFWLDTLSMARGEWGPERRHRLEDVARRLEIGGKIKGTLESTDGIRDLSPGMEFALAEYAIQDVLLTRQAFEIMYFDRAYPLNELGIIDQTLRCYVEPKLWVEPGLCEAEIEAEQIKLEKLLNSSFVDAELLSNKCKKVLEKKGFEGLLASPICFAELLRSRGVAPPMKPSPTHPDDPDKITFAFGKTDLEFQALENDPRVSDLVAARLGTKSTIFQNRAKRFLEVTNNGTKPLPVPLIYCKARTHRWAGSDKINLQNLPSGRKGTSNRLRQAIHVPKGYRLVVADASQIEARTNAWLWGQEDLLELFANNGDPYSDIASKLFGVPVSKKGPNAHLRPFGKAMVLGLGYGMGAKKFYFSALSGAITGDVLELTEEEAEKAVSFYRDVNDRIVAGWRQLDIALAMMMDKNMVPYKIGPCEIEYQRILMPNGLYMHYPNLNTYTVMIEEKPRIQIMYAGQKKYIKIWGSKLTENVVQSLARSIVAYQARKIGLEIPLALLVHDEVVGVVPEKDADDALDFMLAELRTPPPWATGIPLDAEGGHSDRYDVK